MKNLKIQVPEGYEIDEKKSTFSEIVFKKKAAELPKSVKEIPNRRWFIDNGGGISSCDGPNDIDQVTSKERAEAFLALMQLVELRDAWNGGWEWESGEKGYAINIMYGCFKISNLYHTQQTLLFKSQELAEEFLKTFRDLIETAKELI